MAPFNGNTEERPCHCMITACCCCYNAWDCENLVIGLTNSGDCLCIRHSCCIAFGVQTLGCGTTTKEGECCKLGFYCCDCGLVSPVHCCTRVEHLFCIQSVTNLPFDDAFLPECVLSCCGIVCAPSCGCCSAPPPCKALQTMQFERLPLSRIQAYKPMER